ncbi:MAG: DUF362 domain-containing protein [Acidobacteriota bacterium]
MNDCRVITRRDFIRGTTCAGLGATIGFPLEAEENPIPQKRARVILIRDEKVIKEHGEIDGKIIRQMLEKALTAFLDEKDPVKAWKFLVKQNDTVGIKSNVWKYLPTPEPLEKAIMKGLVQTGIEPRKIRIDDRGARNSLADCTALINARPLRTHHWAGVGGCIKNYIMFVPEPSAYHGDICADLGAIWNLPIVRGKTRLNILVMLTPLFYGRGPHHFNRKYVWNYNALLLSDDPVALDAVGVHILERKRKLFFGEERPLKPLTKHITFADRKHRIGTSDLSRIHLIKLGWEKDILI